MYFPLRSPLLSLEHLHWLWEPSLLLWLSAFLSADGLFVLLHLHPSRHQSLCALILAMVLRCLCCIFVCLSVSRRFWTLFSRFPSQNLSAITCFRTLLRTKPIITIASVIWSFLFRTNIPNRDESFRFRNPFYISPFRNLLEFLHLSGTRWNETDLFSLVYVNKQTEKGLEPKSASNVVVDTIRLVSGLPTSRLNDIMEESMEETPVADLEVEEPLYQ